MARKKTNPVEETEQLQTIEVSEQSEVQPEDVSEQPKSSNVDITEEFSDAVLADSLSESAENQECAALADSSSEFAEEQEKDAPEGFNSINADPTPDEQSPQSTASDIDQVAVAAAYETPPAASDHTDETAEVMAVNLSAPAVLPGSSVARPEDLDNFLKTPIAAPPIVSETIPSAPTADMSSDTAASSSPALEKSDRQKFYELEFNRLDRDLTAEERQEWNSIYASYRGRSALTGTIIGVDPFSVQVRNPETGEMEKQTMYCAIVVPYRVRIVIPSSEMWEKDKERPDFVLQNMVGAAIDFIIIKVDREAGFAIGSRRLAARSRRYFFAHRPNLHAVGTHLKCRMLSVGPRRCLVECYGHDIGLTQRELRYTAIPDLRDEYHPGQELDCIVKLYDLNSDRLEVSAKETESNPFVGAEQRHPVGARRLAIIGGKYGGGVFCNLPDGTVCMCNYSYQHEDSDFLVGDNVMLVVQRFEHEKQQMYGKILTKW